MANMLEKCKFGQLIQASWIVSVSLTACVSTQGLKPSDPSATALEPTLEVGAEGGDSGEGSTIQHSQVGPYMLIAPDSAEIDDDTGALEIEFSAPCAQLQLDRVVVWVGRSESSIAKIGLIYAESECKRGSVRQFERTITQGMTEYQALSNLAQPKIRAMAVNDFQLVPATSVIIEPDKQATVTYSASCATVAESSVVTAWDPRSKTMAAAVLYPKSACPAGPAKAHVLKFNSDSDEFQTLGGGEKDLSLRPMWIK